MRKEKEQLEKHLERLLSAFDTIVEARISAEEAIKDSIDIVRNYTTSELKEIEEVIKEFEAEQTVQKLIKIASFISTVSNNCIDDEE